MNFPARILTREHHNMNLPAHIIMCSPPSINLPAHDTLKHLLVQSQHHKHEKHKPNNTLLSTLIAKHHAILVASTWPPLPNGSSRATRCHTSRFKATSFWHFRQVLNETKQSTGNPKYQPHLSSHISMTESQFNTFIYPMGSQLGL